MDELEHIRSPDPRVISYAFWILMLLTMLGVWATLALLWVVMT